jgi:uracil-DNA glycosylase
MSSIYNTIDTKTDNTTTKTDDIKIVPSIINNKTNNTTVASSIAETKIDNTATTINNTTTTIMQAIVAPTIVDPKKRIKDFMIKMLEGVDSDWKNKVLLVGDNRKLLWSIVVNIIDTNYTPEIKNIFRAFKETKYNQVKVVLIGQDPYYNGSAVGLAFSADKDDDVPGSLKRIYNCLKYHNLIKNTLNYTGDISTWAKSGVLMLNAALTTELGTANVHADYWEEFTNNIIINLAKEKEKESRKLAFILWGGFAKKKEALISGTCHKVFKYDHPSPMNSRCNFDLCPNFNEVDTMLNNINEPTINWTPVYILNLVIDVKETTMLLSIEDRQPVKKDLNTLSLNTLEAIGDYIFTDIIGSNLENSKNGQIITLKNIYYHIKMPKVYVDHIKSKYVINEYVKLIEL